MKKITLSISKLREFIVFADKIESAKNIDMLSTKDYIKLEIVMEEVMLTKHNVYAFVKHSFTQADQDDLDGLLINEKIFFDYIKTCPESSKSLYIQYEQKENSMFVSISDNEKMKNKQSFNYSTEMVKIENFPNTDVQTGGVQKTRILQDVISSINIAKGFISKDNGAGSLFCALYIINDCIYASDRFTFYYKKLISAKSLPFIAITTEQIRILNNDLNFIDYCVTPTHNLYYKGNTIFGYRQEEGMNGYDYTQFFEKSPQDYIKVRVDDLMLFCNRSKNLSSLGDLHFIPSRCTVEGNEAIFKYIDTDYGNENINEVAILSSGGIMQPFSLNHSLWYELLKPLPYKEIIINHNPKMPFISITSTEDKEFYCVVSKVNL